MDNVLKGTSLAHQLTAGFVKVYFDGQAENFEVLQEKYGANLPDSAAIEVAGKSVAISIEVPKIDPISVSFTAQVEQVTHALEALSIMENYVFSIGGN